MSQFHRRGSFLLFCIMLVTVLVVLGFTLLQTVRLSADAGTSSQRAWLAQEAAQAGTQHALENIIADARTPGQPTFLDGRWHRDFYALGNDRNQPGGPTLPGADDDTREENVVFAPLRLGGDQTLMAGGNPVANTSAHFNGQDGRARFYEVDYYDPADRWGARFTDMAAAIPPRHDGLFLDPRLHRVQPAAAEGTDAVRKRARFRLRYAVMVNDTGSNLLINPALDVDYRDAWMPGQLPLMASELPSGDPFGDPRYAARFGTARVFAPTELGRRLERYGNSLYNMLNASPSPATEGSVLRLLHIFRLRGSSSNVARAADGWPVAFPSMFRQWDSGTTSLRTMFGSKNPDVGLYVNHLGETRLEGGQVITQARTGDGEVAHSLVGPQFSFRNVLRATAGDSADVDLYGSSSLTASTDQQQALLTPFGRAGERGTRTRPWQWNRGPTDVPWVVNALTAPPGVTMAVIGGCLPPPYGMADIEQYSCYKETIGGDDIFYPVSHTIVLAPATAQPLRQARDLFIDFMSPAFAKWPGQWAATPGAGSTLIWPNWFIPDTRLSVDIYPGPYAGRSRMAGDATKLAEEDTGRLIDTEAAYPCLGWDSHSARQLCNTLSKSSDLRVRGGNDLDDYKQKYTTWQLSLSDNRLPATPVADNSSIETPMPTATPGTAGTWGYSKKDRIVTTTSVPSPDTFTNDIARAFSTALSVLRAHWVQVPNTWTDPVASFPAGRLALTDVDSIEDLDRLFLQQLGIDKDNPASPTVRSSWALSSATTFPRTYKQGGVTLAYNIRKLVVDDKLKVGSVTSVMRARAMELMLNDWRMSLLGASPDYQAAFRPLDFDGDGYAICSAYATDESFADDLSVTSGALTRQVSWPRRPVAVGSAGPAPDTFFSLTGCFTIGKSHYYRIITRGEVWDTLLRKSVSSATQETVVAVDPDGDGVPDAAPSAATGFARDLTVLYQRWYWNRYTGLLPTVYP